MAYTTHGHYVPGTSMDDTQPEDVARCGGPGLCSRCAIEAVGMIKTAVEKQGTSASMELEYFDENTLLKVYHAMSRAGLQYGQIMDAVNEMMNDGILFRERGGKS